MKPASIRYSDASERGSCARAADPYAISVAISASRIAACLITVLPWDQKWVHEGNVAHLELPPQRGLDRPLDQRRRRRDEVWSEFQMLVVRQILAREGQLEMRRRG